MDKNVVSENLKIRSVSLDDTAMQEKYNSVIEAGNVSGGALIKLLRETAGVSKKEIEKQTKVNLRCIEDIEDDQFANLPPRVYILGFVRSILKYLGVKNNSVIIASYAQQLEEWYGSKPSNTNT